MLSISSILIDNLSLDLDPETEFNEFEQHHWTATAW